LAAGAVKSERLSDRAAATNSALRGRDQGQGA
jgi:hypothetical protein